MRKFSRFTFHFFHARRWKSYSLSIMAITGFILFSLFISPSKSYGQAGDLSQIRSGDGKLKNGVLDTCGYCWVNGNAGASNAHYREGYSIAYRSWLTGLTDGQTYEYELGYDTYHGAMAIDFLTHYQRLEPHGPFGHQAEVIDPLYIEANGNVFIFPINSSGGDFMTYDIPVPDPSGIASGVFNQNGTPKDVSNQPVTSFNGLPAAERKMTIYNGEILDIFYVSQAAIVLGGADAETKIRVRFTAHGTQVLLAWGGHIASRLDWGYIVKQNKLVPLSAGGISGSPYHMRQKAMYTVNPDGTNQVVVSGFGNQDRSLSAAAVFPPPECPTVPSQTKCVESTSFVFAIASPQAGVTYNWSFGTNTVDARFAGNTTAASGNNVTVVHNGGGSFTTGGSFTLNITALLNGVPQECPGVATGTVIDVNVTATATSNISVAAGCDASLDRALGNTSQLEATVSGNGTAPYTYLWTDDGNTNGSFSDATIYNPVYTVTGNGEFFVKVVVTDANGCKDSVTKKICVVGSTPPCVVTGPGPICPGTTNVYKYDPDEDGTANAIPANFTAAWTLINNTNGASISGGTTGNTVTVVSNGSNCNSAYTIRITLTSTSGLITTNCSKTVSVVDETAPVLSGCPANVTVDFCSIPAPAPVTATDECPAPGTQVIVTFLETRSNGQNGCSNVITRTWTASDACGNTATCGQTITIVDQDPPLITCPPSVTIKFADSKDDLTKTGAAFASDNCAIAGGYPNYTDDPANPAGGTTFTRTWVVADGAGNTASCSQSITREAEPAGRITSTVQTEATAASTSQQNPELKVKAYPNPFTDQVNFRFTPTKSGLAKMELFDMTGRKLSSIQIGYVQAGVERSHNYRVPALKRVSMFYRIIIGDQSGQGLLLSGSNH
jgi:hypothetical protein